MKYHYSYRWACASGVPLHPIGAGGYLPLVITDATLGAHLQLQSGPRLWWLQLWWGIVVSMVRLLQDLWGFEGWAWCADVPLGARTWKAGPSCWEPRHLGGS